MAGRAFSTCVMMGIAAAPALAGDPTSFSQANPGYAARAGAFYEKEYLPDAVDQLRRAIGADEGLPLPADVRRNLRLFIDEWLDAYVAGGGDIQGPALARVLERLDERMAVVLLEDQRDRYWHWRIGESSEGNALAFLFHYRPPVSRPNAVPGSALARTLGTVAELEDVATVEATRKLLDLMDAGDDIVRMYAARVLAARLPVPDYAGRGCPFTDLRRDQGRRNLAAKAWSATLAADVHAHARQLLTRESQDEAGVGAFMIACIGDVDDLPAVTQAMGFHIEASSKPGGRPTHLSGSFDPFLMASQGLLYQGARPAAVPATTGEIAVYLCALMVLPESRPAGWQGRCTAWKRHEIPYIRYLAELVR